MAPLLARALSGELDFPSEAQRALHGLMMRHRMRGAQMLKAAATLARQCEQAGIRLLVLKGAASAVLGYPELALRPMADVDVLIDEQDWSRLQRAVEGAGFIRKATSDTRDRHELGTLELRDVGAPVCIDVHRRLGLLKLPSLEMLNRQTLEELWTTRQRIGEAEVAFWGLGHADHLRMVFRHAFCLQWDEHELRMQAFADLSGLLEALVAGGEAARTLASLNAFDPAVVRGLAMVPELVPASPAVKRALSPYAGRKASKERIYGIGLGYGGWLHTRRRLYEGTVLSATVFPSEWWLRLRYGSGNGDLPLVLAWGQHLVELGLRAHRQWRGRPRPER